MASNPLVPPSPALLVDRREAARLLSVSPGLIDKLRARGELRPVRVGKTVRFLRADLLALVERPRTPSPGAGGPGGVGGGA